jgi:hypothetical protein
MWEIEVEHQESGRHRLILGPDPVVLEQKAAAILRQWSSIWTRQQLRQNLRSTPWFFNQNALTEIVRTELDQLRNLLRNTLSSSHQVDWSALKSKSNFDEPPPTAPNLEDQPPDPLLLPAPEHRLNLLERLVPQRGVQARGVERGGQADAAAPGHGAEVGPASGRGAANSWVSRITL